MQESNSDITHFWIYGSHLYFSENTNILTQYFRETKLLSEKQAIQQQHIRNLPLYQAVDIVTLYITAICLQLSNIQKNHQNRFSGEPLLESNADSGNASFHSTALYFYSLTWLLGKIPKLCPYFKRITRMQKYFRFFMSNREICWKFKMGMIMDKIQAAQAIKRVEIFLSNSNWTSQFM